MRTIGIRELKAQLSRTLRDVQQGETYLVTDRGRVVAELRPPGSVEAQALTPSDQAIIRMASAGEMRIAQRPRVSYAPSVVHVADGTAQAWLDWTRGDE